MKLVHEGKKDVCIRVVDTNDASFDKIRGQNIEPGKAGDIFPYINSEKEIEILVFIGNKKKKNIEAFYKAYKFLEEHNIEEVSIVHEHLEELFEGFAHAEYKFDKYRKDKKDYELTISADETTDETFNRITNIIDGVDITRDLVNTPSNDMYPESFCYYCEDIFKDLPVEIEILGKEEIKKLGMKAFLEVSKGSDKEPKFIILKYMPEKDRDDHLTFVGKGLTYDSGGYAIKDPKGMSTMKSDMAGAATVVGTIYALAKNNINVNVVGVSALCENMINGSSYKNGDIISSMKGTTIEVGNTDAEGRVTLADSIYYSATKLNSRVIVDLATLTGACIVSLGSYVSGIVSNNDNLSDSIIDASLRADENMFRFKVFDEHREMIKGKFGDIKNSVAGGAGAITAGLFLEEFVENIPWAHLDIAGPAFQENEHSYLPIGATGIPVRTLYEFAKSESER